MAASVHSSHRPPVPVIRLAALVLAAWLLVGCTTGTDALKAEVDKVKADLDALHGRNAEAVADLRAFTVADLQAATARATRAGDLAAMTCYPAITALLLKAGAAQQGQPVGVIDTFEMLRLIVRPIGGKDDTLDVACAALRTQIEKDIIKFDLAVSGIVASGGIAGGPAALKAAPKVLHLLRSLGAGGGP